MTAATHYPVFLDLRDRPCVVLGDSPLAEEKATGLRDAGALVTHHRRAFAAGDLTGAYLAIDASGDLHSQVAARAEADHARVLLNVVDVASRSDWIAPAVVRRGPLQLAISTSGESPFLAATLRGELERSIGPEWGPFTLLMGRLRRSLRRHGVARTSQDRAYRRLLTSPALRHLASGATAAAEGTMAAIDAGARTPAAGSCGEVVLVGAGPGDPGLITVAGRDALARADVVLHDSLVGDGVLGLCSAAARLVDVGKRAGRPSPSQDEINRLLVSEASAGRTVVRLKGGDPFLFGRGGEEVAALCDAGVPVRVIPGVSSALGGPASAGVPVTHRGLAASVAVVSGRRMAGADSRLEAVAAAADTLVVLMPGNLDLLTARLARVRGPACPAAVIAAAASSSQQVVRAPLGRLAAAARHRVIGGPVTVVVGEVVDALPAGNGWEAGWTFPLSASGSAVAGTP